MNTAPGQLNPGLRAWQAQRAAVRAAGEDAVAEANAAWAARAGDRAVAAKARAQALQRQRRSKRRAAERLRAPAWADQGAIKDVYLRAQHLSQSSGTPHHVDHFYPLCGKLVSGLHVHQNLQVIPAVDNMRKHNRFEVEP